MYLVTGAGGYIGRHLVQALRAQGHLVRALDCHGPALEPLAAQGAETLLADAADPKQLPQALRDVRVIYHLAGSALGTRKQIWRANLQSSITIAQACHGSKVEALIVASSGALYPNRTTWLDETVPPAPAFTYAHAKQQSEQAMLELHQHHQLPVQIARIAAVYGPHSPALMLNHVRRGRFPLIGGGQGYASHIHIDDLITALLAMPTHGQAGDIYNLADDHPAPIAAFYGLLAQLLQAPPPPKLNPRKARALVWFVNSSHRLLRRTPPLPIDLVAMASVSHRMCNRRMRHTLHVTPRYPSYRDGLPAVVAACGMA